MLVTPVATNGLQHQSQRLPSHQISTSSSTRAMDAKGSGATGAELEKQFTAAVNVIRNLPTNGDLKNAPFQPSDELKLRFYAYYKQATEGPNTTPRPAFYDIVGKYKWQAWTSLGNMSREDAMRAYVNELKTIIEPMSMSEAVTEFYDVIGPFYEFVFPDKQGKHSKQNGQRSPDSDDSTSPERGPSNGYGNGDISEEESDGEEFSDTYTNCANTSQNNQNTERRMSADEIISARGEAELTPPRFGMASSSNQQSSSRSSSNRQVRQMESSGPGSSSGSAGGGRDKPQRHETIPDFSEQIAFAILRLQQSMEQVELRLHSLEQQIRTANEARTGSSNVTGSGRKTANNWWPFESLSPTTAIFFLVWPVVTQLALERFRNQRSGK